MDDTIIDNQISSIRFLIPLNNRYILFDDVNFNQHSVTNAKITLIGSGKWEEIPDLELATNSTIIHIDHNFNDRISSSKFEA